MTPLLSLLEHVAWADERVHDALGTLEPTSAEYIHAARLYAHLSAAEHVWLSRLRGEPSVHAVWPDLTAEEALALARASLAGVREVVRQAVVEGTLDRAVTYVTTAGQTFTSSLTEIVTHVALHGSYHRGQIALLTRQGGGRPEATDYIVFLRGVAAPPQAAMA